MRLVYRDINANDLRGATVADYLVNIEALFEVVDGRKVIYSEPYFPVAELARELARWLPLGESPAPDFYFTSLSFEDPGAVMILRGEAGWTVGTMFTPEVKSSPLPWDGLATCIGGFISDVRRDVLGLGISPDFLDPAES